MRRRGFTFYELMVCVVVLSIITVGALPDNRAKLTQEAELAADKLETDVDYARSLSIANPADPAIIKFDQSNNKYWIARKSSPDTPVTHPLTKQPYVVKLGATGPQATNHVAIVGLDVGNDQIIQFDGSGALNETSSPIVQLSAGQAKSEVSVASGTAKCTVTTNFSALSTSGTVQSNGATSE
jgi:prepilin-type N-terminal cleavage/methylation domain-containing protein